MDALHQEQPHADDGGLSRIVGGIIPPIQLLDESHGLFGELIPPELVLEGLGLSNHKNALATTSATESDNSNNGTAENDPRAALAFQAVRSLLADDDAKDHEVCIEFDNQTALPITIRWLDEYGRSFDHYNFTVEAHSSAVRYSRQGHLFLLSVSSGCDVSRDDDDDDEGSAKEELLLGAYRLRMTLPSKSPHYVRVEQVGTNEVTATNSGSNSSSFAGTFILEAMLADPTGEDELVVAAKALENNDDADAVAGTGPYHDQSIKSIKTLSTILTNLRQHPQDPKYHTLRLSNTTIQKQIASNWGAMQMLKLIGFVRSQVHGDNKSNVSSTGEKQMEECLTWKDQGHDCESQRKKLNRACELVELLCARNRPGFVSELAPSPPWQGPILTLAVPGGAGRRASFGNQRTTFLSDDEKWKRAQRNAQRRGRSGRKPEPGNAPSSRGKWGR